jgi:hypothetical protein
MTNDWCRTLGIEPPTLDAVAHHREANTFAHLLVALLERGRPMTLADASTRFEEAGIAGRARALASLKRCKPGRPPVYRDGDLYHLDPHDHDLDLWVFRLGLRPPKVARAEPPPLDRAPLPGPNVALTPGELDKAWTDANLSSWSFQRLVLAVLDAHGAPLLPIEVVAAVAQRTRWHGLTEDSAKFKRRGATFVKNAMAFEKKHPCPSCVPSPAALHTFLVGFIDTSPAVDGGVSASIYCAGTTPLGGDDVGLVPPDAATAKCEVGVNKNFGKYLPAATGKCHIQQAASAFSHQTFDDEGCELALETKYNAANAKLTGCPPCLDAKHVFEENLGGFDAGGLMFFYCASPSGAFLE